MNFMKKKLLLAMLLLLATSTLLMSCFSLTSPAEDTTVSDTTVSDIPSDEPSGLLFELNADGESFYVTGIDPAIIRAVVDLTIPSTHNGKPVTGIGMSAFEGCENLSSLTIPASITRMYLSSFTSCRKLTSVVFADTIGWKNHSMLSSSGEGMLIQSELLADPAMAASILKQTAGPAMYMYNTSSTEGDYYPFFEFELNTSGESYRIVKLVGGSSDNIGITLPNSYNGLPVTVIGEKAFQNCSYLFSVTIPDSVKSIGKYAFSGCSGLEHVNISSSVRTIGTMAFSGCTSLSQIIVDEANESYQAIDGHLYSKDGEALTLIQYAAGSDATSYYLPDGLCKIDAFAFEMCPNLTEITVSEANEHYKSVDGNLYSKDGKALVKYAVGKTDTSFIVPDGVTSIEAYAFFNCKSIESVTIPESVTDIELGAFYGCDSLDSAIFEATSDWRHYSTFDSSLLNNDIPQSSISDPTLAAAILKQYATYSFHRTVS